MFTTLMVFQVLVAAGLIAIVLVQRGPGATMGAAFGSGASGTVFGSRGAGNFLTRTTSWLAVGFFGISLALAVLATSLSSQVGDESALSGSVMEQQEQPVQNEESVGIESAIDDLDNGGDNPATEQQTGAIDAVDQPEQATASEEATQDDDGTLPEPPSGS
ncbi:MAG TPA: preprotein translocase subunit SecG [Wenzhouxiangellaceae bacterium]|nr:preprotein translocase subunit SecG [Wenzhouxiangellaceae bacterium]